MIDPAHGSWYVEALTDAAGRQGLGAVPGRSRPRAAWREALESGFIQGEIARVAEARAKSIANGRVELTGVSAFPMLADDGVKVDAASRRPIRS